MSVRSTGAEPLEPGDGFDDDDARAIGEVEDVEDDGEVEGYEGYDEFAAGGGEADEDGDADDARDDGESEAPTRQARAPWHFKMLLVGSVGYLGWRAYQGISWLAHHIH